MIFKKLRWKRQKTKCAKAKFYRNDQLSNYGYCNSTVTPFYICHPDTCPFLNKIPENDYSKLGVKDDFPYGGRL